MMLLKVAVFLLASVSWSVMSATIMVNNLRINEIAKLVNFSPKSGEWVFFNDCLANETTSFNKRQAAMCDRLLSTVSRMRKTKHPTRMKRNTRYLPYQMYDIELTKMENAKHHGAEHMFNMVAPCSKFSHSVKKQWMTFFRLRTRKSKNERTTVPTYHQNLFEDEIEATFILPASYNASVFSQHEMVAVDLLILRTPPCKIDQLLESYTLSVDQIIGNRSRTIHRSKQATCPTLSGELMVAGLNISAIKPWFYELNGSLILRVRLRSDRLLGQQPKEDTPILRKVLSLIVHHKLGHAKQQVQPIVIQRKSQSLTRHKRGLAQFRKKLKPSNCHIENYPYKLQTYNEEFEILYPKVWNIKECVGRCSYPLFNMNSTNHGLAMSEQLTFHPNPPFQPTVNCVPIHFTDIHHVSYGPDGILQSGFISNMAADYCGCV